MDMAVTYPLECAPGSNLRFKRAIPELFPRLATFVDSISVSKTHLIVSSFLYRSFIWTMSTNYFLKECLWNTIVSTWLLFAQRRTMLGFLSSDKKPLSTSFHLAASCNRRSEHHPFIKDILIRVLYRQCRVCMHQDRLVKACMFLRHT